MLDVDLGVGFGFMLEMVPTLLAALLLALVVAVIIVLIVALIVMLIVSVSLAATPRRYQWSIPHRSGRSLRLWRVPNTINSKSGLYKIPLTVDELSLSIDEIRALAAGPRAVPASDTLVLLPSPTLVALLGDADTQPDVPGTTTATVLENVIPEGSRNTTLTSLAGSMRRRGMQENEILAALTEINKRCAPSLPASELEAIARSVAGYEPTDLVSDAAVDDVDELVIHTAVEFVALPTSEQRWEVDGLIPYGGAAIIAGSPGTGKSWMGLALGIAAATGRPFLGQFEAQQGVVVMVDEENTASALKARLLLLTPEPPADLYLCVGQGIRLDQPASVDRLIARVRVLDPVLIILDSFIRLHGQDENSATAMATVFGAVTRMRRETGAAVVLLDHLTKPSGTKNLADRLRGSGDKHAYPDSLLSVEKVADRPLRVRVTHSKSRTAEPVPSFEIELRPSDTGLVLAYVGRAGQRDRAAEALQRVELVHEVLQNGDLASDELIEEMCKREPGLTKAAAARAIDRMTREGALRTRLGASSGGRPPLLYTLPTATKAVGNGEPL